MFDFTARLLLYTTSRKDVENPSLTEKRVTASAYLQKLSVLK